jgi:magnesium transporter
MSDQVAVSEQDEDRLPLLELDPEMVIDVTELIRAEQQGMVLNLVADLYPADLAQLFYHLEFNEAVVLFSWLPAEKAARVLPELEDNYRTVLLENQSSERITVLLDLLESDDATDVLADLPEEIALRVLPRLEDAASVGELLSYGEETAGGIMGTELLAVRESASLADVTEEVRRNAEIVEPVYVVYIVDDAGRLLGLLSLKQLLLYPADVPIGKVMETDLVTVDPYMDQEEVARIMERYDLVSLPVVDDDGYLLGRVMIDDVVDVILEEAEEDIQRMSGISGDEEFTASVLAVSGGRLPWLVIGLAGAFLSGMVISIFEEGLEQAIVLATFIPIVTATGGNAAIQSAAISVQALTSGELWAHEVAKRLGKEVSVALLNGIILSASLALVVALIGWMGLLDVSPEDLLRLAVTIGLTMFAIVILATSNGAMTPILLTYVGADPADSMGPFVTTMNDIIGLTVYFLIANAIYL